MKNELWVGTVEGIFGYGMSVISDSEAGVMKALKAEYRRWKRQYPNEETSFAKSFEWFGGSVKKVKLGKVYYDNFNE